MAGSKKIRRKVQPKGKGAIVAGNPDSYGGQKPSWCFNRSDKEQWSLNEKNASDKFWSEILPHLEGWETQTWDEILVKNKKHNHFIDVEDLNKAAQQRLAERMVEADAVVSLSLSNTHRLYGYLIGAVFYILWYDKGHGDNDGCVCRSRKKHT